jgi:hypothetical protein
MLFAAISSRFVSRRQLVLAALGVLLLLAPASASFAADPVAADSLSRSSPSADSLATDSLASIRDRVASEPSHGLTRADRLQHASLAFASGIAIGVVTDEPLAGAGGALTLGLAKEWFDRHGSGFDGMDLLADAIGAALAGWLLAGLSR